MEKLVSDVTQDYLSKVENSKIGITSHEVDIVYWKCLTCRDDFSQVFS